MRWLICVKIQQQLTLQKLPQYYHAYKDLKTLLLQKFFSQMSTYLLENNNSDKDIIEVDNCCLFIQEKL
ncbi:unnamed protein product [Paramecium octaurelia]|uniref:Uncharacterized protein n=1 Tax=Paramecium octaurelia TaxID=43137 RepID=A0A8S1YI25_PAROT|nr:unnamed protein product [Paramecium octaurelia]